MPTEDRLPCPVCQVGRTRLRLVTYTRVYNDTLVSVPNTPAWECDFCHTHNYDPDALTRIELLVGQAGPPPNRPDAQPRPDAEPESGKSRPYPADQ